MGEIRKENLHQSLIEYLDGLGLTEEQVQGLINSGLVNTNTRVDELHTSLSNAWSTINEINTRELNGQQYKLTTDEGQGFGLSYQDANSCTGTGTIYFGENITNSPNCQVGIWWTIENYVTADGQWGHQIATAWHSDEVYIRRKTSDGWLPWRSL